MNLEQAELLTLEEFLARFSNNELTIEQFLLAAKRYPAFYAAIEGRLAALPTVSNPEEARLQLLGIIEQYRLFPEQVRRENPTSTTPIGELQHHAEILHEATTKAQEVHKSSLEELQKTYPKRLLDNFIARHREQLGEAVLTDALKKTEEKQPARSRMDQALTNLGVVTKEKQRIIADVEQVTVAQMRSDPALAAPLRMAATLDTTASLLIENPRIKADAAFTIARELAETSPALSPTKVAEAAFTHTTMLEALTGGVEDTRGAGTRVFYQVYAKGAQKLIAPVGDFLFRMMPQEWRVEVIEDQVAKSFVRVAGQIERAGEKIVESPVFKQYVDQARRHQQPTTPTTGIQKARNTVSDFMGLVFGNTDPVARAVYENGQVLWKPMGISLEAAPLLGFHYAGLATKMPGLFSLTVNGAGRWGLSFAAKKGAAVAGEKLAGTALGKLIGGLFGSTAGPIGAIAGSLLLDKVIGFAGGVVKGIFSIFTGEMFQRILAGEVKADWRKDMPLLIALGAVLAIVLLFVFPWFLNPRFIYQLATDTPLATAQSGGGPAGGGPFAPPKALQELQCLVQAAGVTKTYTVEGVRETINSIMMPEDKWREIEAAMAAYPLGLINCILGCPATQINLTLLNYYSSDGYWGWAPDNTNIYFYLGAFGHSSRDLAKLIAHELGHQIAGHDPDIYDAFVNGTTEYPSAHCNSLSTYRYKQNSEEVFAEAISLYIIGDATLQRECPGAYDFMNRLFSRCAAPRSVPTIACKGPIRIMPVGDSITVGYDLAPGYRDDLESSLKSAGYNVSFVGSQGGHEGYNNTNPTDIASALRANNSITTYQPNVVLLHAGTVNLQSQFLDNITGLGAIINEILTKSNATIYLARIIKRYDVGDAGLATRFNNEIAKYAGSRVILVDMENAVTPQEQLPADIIESDGVHPTNQGYTAIAGTWKNAIQGLLAQCRQ